jgi:asparagine synthetase B (glutamine-hydrolysing)
MQIANALKIEPYIFNPESEVIQSELEKMLKVLEIPVHIPLGPLPQFRLFKEMARQGIRTVYSGQG